MPEPIQAPEDKINIAKDFLKQHLHLSDMADGNFNVDKHDPSIDSHVVDLLDDVDQSHIKTDPYHVVTVNKSVTAEDGAIIPRSIKVEIDKDNNVKNVLESK
jgi:hypothetical protein